LRDLAPLLPLARQLGLDCDIRQWLASER
jgi:hypothetical protein